MPWPDSVALKGRHAPEGVDIRPIKQMDGGGHFNGVLYAVGSARQLPAGRGRRWLDRCLNCSNGERLAIGGVQPTSFPREFLDMVKKPQAER
jgi:hypothetical protein